MLVFRREWRAALDDHVMDCCSCVTVIQFNGRQTGGTASNITVRASGAVTGTQFGVLLEVRHRMPVTNSMTVL